MPNGVHLTEKIRKAVWAALVERNDTATKIADKLGVNRGTVYKERDKLMAAGYHALVNPEPEPVEEPQGDPIEVRRLRDTVSHQRALITDLERRAGDAENVRSSVLGLMHPPPRPAIPAAYAPNKRSHGRRSVVLCLSDIHYGEVIDREEIDGLNAYNVEIAEHRLGRFFNTTSDLMTDHWTGKPPEEIVLWVGGDLISGDIHGELTATNEPTVPECVKEIGELIAGGIKTLADRVKTPIRVYSTPGNHGRSTVKPQSKKRTRSSFDMLAMDFCEVALRGSGLKKVTFHRSLSSDARFQLYRWHFLANHGDNMGAGGGRGYIGPLAPITKGHRKIVDVTLRTGYPVNYVLTGHFHTTARTTFGWANGSVVGFSEFARDLRADPEPAKQNMLVVNDEKGVIQHAEIYLGHPSEGTMYGKEN